MQVQCQSKDLGPRRNWWQRNKYEYDPTAKKSKRLLLCPSSFGFSSCKIPALFLPKCIWQISIQSILLDSKEEGRKRKSQPSTNNETKRNKFNYSKTYHRCLRKWLEFGEKKHGEFKISFTREYMILFRYILFVLEQRQGPNTSTSDSINFSYTPFDPQNLSNFLF